MLQFLYYSTMSHNFNYERRLLCASMMATVLRFCASRHLPRQPLALPSFSHVRRVTMGTAVRYGTV